MVNDIYVINKQDKCRQQQQQRTLSCLTAVSRAPFVDILREEHAANAARPLIGLTSRGGLPRARLQGGSGAGAARKSSITTEPLQS